MEKGLGTQVTNDSTFQPAEYMRFRMAEHWNAGEPYFGDRINLSPERKLLFCRIEKVASSLFADLVCSLNKRHRATDHPHWQMKSGVASFEWDCDWYTPTPESLDWGKYKIHRIFADPEWQRVVVVRDPLECVCQRAHIARAEGVMRGVCAMQR